MNFLKKLLSKKEETIVTYHDFWKWFIKNEKSFYNVVQQNKDVNKDFLEKLKQKLHAINEGSTTNKGLGFYCT